MQTNSVTRYVGQNLDNCRNKLYNKFTTNRSNGARGIQLTDLQICSKQPRLIDCHVGVNKLNQQQ